MYIQSITDVTLTKRKVVPDNFRYLNFSFALERHLLYNEAYVIIGTSGRSSYVVRWDNQSVVMRTSFVGLLIIDSGFFQLPCRNVTCIGKKSNSPWSACYPDIDGGRSNVLEREHNISPRKLQRVGTMLHSHTPRHPGSRVTNGAMLWTRNLIALLDGPEIEYFSSSSKRSYIIFIDTISNEYAHNFGQRTVEIATNIQVELY